jgi:hypothetical protein
MANENPSVQPSPSDIHRAAELKWRNAPPGMPPALADEFMARLRAGSTVRKLTSGIKEFGPALATLDRFKKHCQLQPEWGAEAWRTSKANARAGRIARFRAMTHCKHGHSLVDASLYQKDGYVARHCRICRAIRAKRPATITPEAREKVRALLRRRLPISYFVKPGTGNYVMSHVTFTHLRREDDEINSLAVAVISDAQQRAQDRRWARVRNRTVKEESNDYYRIMAMLPHHLSPDMRDDVAQSIFVALLEGSLRRDEVRKRLPEFVTAHNRDVNRYSTGKFGLISIDAPMFAESSTTLADTITRGLWD